MARGRVEVLVLGMEKLLVGVRRARIPAVVVAFVLVLREARCLCRGASLSVASLLSKEGIIR
jgi:hypothetical protein|tara:strand:- start:10964 stop:11149 length:186 start_codon:yes stop_codon:yes gene_type:complete